MYKMNHNAFELWVKNFEPVLNSQNKIIQYGSNKEDINLINVMSRFYIWTVVKEKEIFLVKPSKLSKNEICYIICKKRWDQSNKKVKNYLFDSRLIEV